MWANVVGVMVVVMAINVMVMRDADFVFSRSRRGNYLRYAGVLERARVSNLGR